MAAQFEPESRLDCPLTRQICPAMRTTMMTRRSDIFAAIERTGVRRGGLREWMRKNHDAFAEKLRTVRPNWDLLADVFAKAGLTDQRGNPPQKGETVRKTWQRVRREMSQAQPAPRVPKPKATPGEPVVRVARVKPAQPAEMLQPGRSAIDRWTTSWPTGMRAVRRCRSHSRSRSPMPTRTRMPPCLRPSGKGRGPPPRDAAPKLVLALGRGKTGKSTFIRWAAEGALERGAEPVIADADRTNATLAAFFENVTRPDSPEDEDVRLWLNEFVDRQIDHRFSAFIDLGGGDLILKTWARDLHWRRSSSSMAWCRWRSTSWDATSTTSLTCATSKTAPGSNRAGQ